MTDRPTSRSPISIATRVPVPAPASASSAVYQPSPAVATDTLAGSAGLDRGGGADTEAGAGSDSSFSTANERSFDLAPSFSSSSAPATVDAGLQFAAQRTDLEVAMEAELERASIIESIVFSDRPPSGRSSVVTSPAEADVAFLSTGPRISTSRQSTSSRIASAAGSGRSGTGSREYIAALRGLSSRGAERSASVIGGVGGVVGQPMGLPVVTMSGATAPVGNVSGMSGGSASTGLTNQRSASRTSHLLSCRWVHWLSPLLRAAGIAEIRSISVAADCQVWAVSAVQSHPACRV